MPSSGKTARRYRRPKLGQHFLHDPNILGRIVAALGLSPGQIVVEVGPGTGALTRRLLDAGARVLAIELDHALAEGLREQFQGEERFELIEKDVLDVDFADVVRGRSAVLAGNLPYYITSPIVRKTVAEGGAFDRAVFLVQQETAERIAGRKGSRDYGYLSAVVRLQCETEVLFSVPPGAFRPPPRVQSAVIRLTRKGEASPDPSLVKFLEAAFRHPRKTLLNNLAPVYSRTAVLAQPEAGLRAQQLEVEELRDLWTRLEKSVTKSAP